jgi:hypothetical protein
MLTKTKMLLAAALILGSASASFAQGVVPDYDGDGNRIRGQYDVLPSAPSSIERSFAGPRHQRTDRPAGPRHQLQQPVYPYGGANGPAWERNFERWLQQS